MPKVTEEHRQARREQILEAALNCFARNGFHQTSMRDICKEAGLSAGAVYLHFASKEDIIEESWQRVREARAARIEVIKQEGFTLQSFNRFWDYYEERMTKADTDRIWLLGIQITAEALRNPRIRESIRVNWNEAEKHTIELLRHAIEQDFINPDLDCDAIGGMFTALHDGLILMKIINPDKDVHKYFRACRNLISNYGKTPYSKVKEESGQ